MSVETWVAVLCSGVLANVITIVWNNRAEQLMIKRKLADELFATRHQLSKGMVLSPKGIDEFRSAFNKIPIVFAEHKEVIDAFNKFWEYKKNKQHGEDDEATQLLIDIFREVCKAAKIKGSDKWGKEIFERIF